MTPTPDSDELLDAYGAHLAARLTRIAMKDFPPKDYNPEYQRHLLKEIDELEFRIMETGSYLESLTADP